MYMYLKFLFGSLLLVLAAVATAQNPRFSQVQASTLVLNPALAGSFDGVVRGGLHFSHMSTKRATIQHINAFIELRGKSDKAHNGYNHFGVGFNFYNYGFNAAAPLAATFPSISGAYHFKLGKTDKHFMGVGAQFAYAFGRLDETKGVNDPEISGGGFRYVPSAALNNNTADQEYGNASIGMYYRYKGEDVTFESGLSLFHLHYPRNDIFGNPGSSVLRHRGTMHMRLDMKLNENRRLSLHNVYWTNGLYWRSPAVEPDNIVDQWLGVEMQNHNPEADARINYGLATRSFRSLIPHVSFFITPVANLRVSYEHGINDGLLYRGRSARRIEAVFIMQFAGQ